MTAESRGTQGERPARPIVYCLIPPDLAPRLHDLLRRHFADDRSVEVIVERRHRERRSGRDRRAESISRAGEERRGIRNVPGRRVGERRAALVPVEAPELPRRARRYADRIAFVERFEPSTEQAEDLDTARLVTRFQAGEQETFGTLYARYFDRVYAYLRVALKDAHEAEDLAQVVFMQVLEALPRYERRRQPFRSWLFAVVRNHALMHLRKAARVDVVDPHELSRRRDREQGDDWTPDAAMFDWITDRDLLVLVDRLPLPQRQVLALRYMLDLRGDEIARILDRTPADVRTLHHRAVRFLRQRLTALGRTPSDRGRAPMQRSMRPANVLRARRYALFRG